MIAGVDGCKHKWIAVVQSDDGHILAREPCEFRYLIEDASLDLIVIDIPIGLRESGPREADRQARRHLQHRHVCVFPAPTRRILDCSSREQASRQCVEAGDPKVNVFQWAIVPKVKQIDCIVREMGDARNRIREGHPELSFTLMNGDVPLISKKKKEGLAQRQSLIERHLWVSVTSLTPHLEDVLDAYALLWTAQRIQRHKELRLPAESQVDKFGLRMEISA